MTEIYFILIFEYINSIFQKVFTKNEVCGIELDKKIFSNYYKFFNIDILLTSDSIDILNKIRSFFPHFYDVLISIQKLFQIKYII